MKDTADNRYHEVYTIENFPGLVMGGSLSKNPPGAFSLGDGKTIAAHVTDFGELYRPGLFSRVAQLTGSNFANVSALTYWSPPVGGDYILLSLNDRIKYLSLSPTSAPTFVPLDDSEVDLASRLACNTSDSFAMFESFKDTCFFVDGINPPLRISLDGANATPVVREMGVLSGDIDLASAVVGISVKNVAGMGYGLDNGIVRKYAVTAVSQRGESIPYFARVDLSTTLPNQTYTFGPVTSSPTLIFNWAYVPKDINFLLVYRQASTGLMQYLTKITRGTYSFVDAVPDSALGYPMGYDNQLPGQFRILRSFGERMFAVGGFGNPNRLSCSKIGQPDVWPAQYEMNHSGTTGGVWITQLAVISTNLFVFTKSGIFRLTGFSPEDFKLEPVSHEIGCVAPKSLVEWNDGVIFLSDHGVFFFNGTNLNKISSSIDTLFQRPTGYKGWSSCCGALANSNYLLSYTDCSDNASGPIAGGMPEKTLLCSMNTLKWGIVDKYFTVSSPYVEGQSLVVGRSPGETNKFLSQVSDNWLQEDCTTTSDFTFFLPNMDFGIPDVNKSLARVELLWEGLHQPDVTVQARREVSFKDENDIFNGVLSVTTVEEINIAEVAFDQLRRYGDSWTKHNRMPNIRAFRTVHTFESMQGRSFAFQITVGSNSFISPEVRLQKMLIYYTPEKEAVKGYVQTQTRSTPNEDY